MSKILSKNYKAETESDSDDENNVHLSTNNNNKNNPLLNKIFKSRKNGSYRFKYRYISPIIKSENIIILDSKQKDKISGDKIYAYKIFSDIIVS